MIRLVLFVILSLLALPVFAASAALPETNAVLAGAAYIKSIQTADGTYGANSPGQNMDAVLAVRAAGYDPAKDLVGGKGPAQFLIANASAVPSAAAAAKAALGAKALGLDPKSVGGTDLIAKVNAGYDPTKGTYAGDDFSQSLAMLGLACTGNSVPAGAINALKATEVATGGGWGFGGTADPDTTALAIQALLASGTPKTDAAVIRALAHLKGTQGTDGGWGFDPAESNANSTAFVIQAFLALGENPEADAFKRSGVTPVAYLLSQQNPDGSFKGFDPAFATNQVLPALAGRTFCNAPETPITRSRPVVVTTPAPAPANPPTTAATAAPRPPSAGSGARPEGDGSKVAFIAVGLVLVLAGTTFAAARRRE